MKSYLISSVKIDDYLYKKLLVDLQDVTHLTVYRIKTTVLLAKIIEYVIEIGKIVYLKLELECIHPLFHNVLAKNRSIRHLHIAFRSDEIYIPLNTLLVLSISSYKKRRNENKALYNSRHRYSNWFISDDRPKISDDLLWQLTKAQSLMSLHLITTQSFDRVIFPITSAIRQGTCSIRYLYVRVCKLSPMFNIKFTLFDMLAYHLFYQYDNFDFET